MKRIVLVAVVVIAGAVTTSPIQAQTGVPAAYSPIQAEQKREPRYDGKPLSYWIEQFQNCEDYGKREQFVGVIGAFGPDAAPAVPALVEMLEDHSPGFRGHVVKVLCSIGPGAKSAVPTLIRSLEQKKARNPNEVIQILGAIGPDAKEAVPLIHRTIREKGAEIALEPLAGFGSDVVPLLLELLEDKNLGSLQEACVSTLGKIGPPAKPAVPALTKLLKHQDEELRFNVAMALWQIDKNGDGVPILITDLKKGREWWVKNPAQGGGAFPSSPRPPRMRLPAIELLGVMGPAAKLALPELEAALADPANQAEAMAAIEKIDPEAAKEIKKRQPVPATGSTTGGSFMAPSPYQPTPPPSR